jgi:hypothetical protein
MSTPYTPYTSNIIGLGVIPVLQDADNQTTARAIYTQSKDNQGNYLYQLIYGKLALSLLPVFNKLPFFPTYFEQQKNIQVIDASYFATGFFPTFQTNTQFFRNDDAFVFAPVSFTFSLSGSTSQQVTANVTIDYPTETNIIPFNACPGSTTPIQPLTPSKPITGDTQSFFYGTSPQSKYVYDSTNFYFPNIVPLNDTQQVFTSNNIFSSVEIAFYGFNKEKQDAYNISTYDDWVKAIKFGTSDTPDDIFCVFIGSLTTTANTAPGYFLLTDPGLLQGYSQGTPDASAQFSGTNLKTLLNTIQKDFLLSGVQSQFQDASGTSLQVLCGLIRIPFTSQQAGSINIKARSFQCIFITFKKPYLSLIRS